MALNTIALFGANGQIGQKILEKLTSSSENEFKVLSFIPPDDELSCGGNDHKAIIKAFDLDNVTREGLAKDLKGVDAVICALNDKALDYQPTIQDAAADAGVKRFYPSEYGMHHIYRKPGDNRGYLHPLWNQKSILNEEAVLHPAVRSGKMSYTVIGCGEFYNQEREPGWCPWTRDDVSEYTIHVIGDPDAKADFTHLDDMGAYVVATLLEPEKSENAYLNFVSDTVSHMEIADALRKRTGKTVTVDFYPIDKMHEVAADPSKAPKELRQSAFSSDFWFIVKGTQGAGRFVWPRGQVHNHLFPNVQPTTFDMYFQKRFKGRKGEDPGESSE